MIPDFNDFQALLKEIWDSKWVTNNGNFHKCMESALCEYLMVLYTSLFTNGTSPLLTALQAMRITGVVKTTPYSFVATTHAIWWKGCKPVFVEFETSGRGHKKCHKVAIRYREALRDVKGIRFSMI